MILELAPEESVSVLISRLNDPSAVVRETSRNQLIEAGDESVVRALIELLSHRESRCRWEAALALRKIASPIAAEALMNAMDDEDPNVRWVASLAISALGMVGIRTVLSGLTKRAQYVAFRDSAHHVLRDLRSCSLVVEKVLESLASPDPALTAPCAAYNAMLELDDAEKDNCL